MQKVKMDKAERVYTILAMATKAIYDTREIQEEGPSEVIFINRKEFQTMGSGSQATNHTAEENPLQDWIEKVVEMYIKDERKHWVECCWNTNENLPQDKYGNLIYSPELCPDHIYHTLKKLSELISF